ncbi:glycoside hydrolase family 3 protein [Occultella glacieicola]|uniref:Glycoside hydrolase family 3 protein n=1 Tax=Occultella glacieicola TaxID=2518684 RepID=A0ABY2DY71_9MICO|nr:glycoside hydrolase family 3 C-terminal domain-containing protein [Occultella glacieicola]TDE89262.1 glycoside hydrolase family 3 protein [Occultella glacieicola]
MTSLPTDDLRTRVASLTLTEKVTLLTGATAWSTHAHPGIGLAEVVMSDGPAGVRGIGAGTSTSLPAPSALAATWDTEQAARIGRFFAAAARRRGVDVVLAPVLNLQRTPVGGRHFENHSEDPHLTAEVGAAVIAAMQGLGVAACAKHFVANDSETDRTTYTARVDEVALREVYLPPFHRGVIEAGAWTVMSAYNGLDDGVEAAPAGEHRGLLTGLLKQEWGYDGLVVSDWAAARTTAPTANAGMDLVMPGPHGPWHEALVAAVEAGEVSESLIDDKVVRLLRLAARVGKLDGVGRPPIPAHLVEEGRVVARDLAARATVVLRRGAAWPLDAGAPNLSATTAVALIGANAAEPYVQGGGSAKVRVEREVSPLEGLTDALDGTGAVVRFARGGGVLDHAPMLEADLTTDPVTGAPGVRLSAHDAAGTVLAQESQLRTDWTWHHGFPERTAGLVLRTIVHLTGDGSHELELGAIGYHDVLVDGELVASVRDDDGARAVLNSSVNAPEGVRVPVAVEGSRDIEVELRLHVVDTGQYGRLISATLRHARPGPDADAEIETAVALAARSDVAVVVVGTNAEVESEGWDRASLALPGRQDELVHRVAAANPRTVVVVNAGAPVLMPWLAEVDTVLWAWLPGQEFGHALADVLLGRSEPAGRLPWTLPADAADVPVPDGIPVDGVIDYREGTDVGYLGWQRLDRTPALPFGHGLGWTDFAYGGVTVASGPDGGLSVAVDVTNVGGRDGREVVQVYLERPGDPGMLRLAAFATVEVAAGAGAAVDVPVPARALERWAPEAPGWRRVGGTYRVHVGRSVADIRARVDVAIDGGVRGVTALEFADPSPVRA